MKLSYNGCLELATKAHEGQKRKDGKEYISHPIIIASKFDDEDLKSIAILHDVLEDTTLTSEILLKQGVPMSIIQVVEILTRDKNENYFDYIHSLIISKNAVVVKIEDLKHNLSDLEEGSMKDKYRFALEYLEEQLIWGNVGGIY